MRKYLKNFLLRRVKKIGNAGVRDRIKKRLFGGLFFPSTIVIDVTSICNAECPFCPRTLVSSGPGVNMEDQVFYDLVDQADHLGIKETRLYASGESLLHPNIDKYIRYLKDKKFHVIISTNAQFLDRHFEALSKVDWIKYSIEGWDRKSYEYYRKNCSYDVVLSNIRAFKEYLSGQKIKPYISISVMVNRETDIEKFNGLWSKYVDRVDYGKTMGVFDWEEGRIRYRDFKDERCRANMYSFQLRKNVDYCANIFETITFSPSGKAVICCQDFNGRIVLGDIKKTGLKEIIRSPARRALQNEFMRGSIDTCKDCVIFYEMDDRSRDDFNGKLSGIQKKEGV
ncbi:MAG: radical SAM protein [Candidatus Omnitrophica bacterium]|nr:radical SAM protein [Candidatus Omnitrophota bacterium]